MDQGSGTAPKPPKATSEQPAGGVRPAPRQPESWLRSALSKTLAATMRPNLTRHLTSFAIVCAVVAGVLVALPDPLDPRLRRALIGWSIWLAVAVFFLLRAWVYKRGRRKRKHTRHRTRHTPFAP